MSETFDADAIIAGAGMAGATLALALKQGGQASDIERHAQRI